MASESVRLCEAEWVLVWGDFVVERSSLLWSVAWKDGLEMVVLVGVGEEWWGMRGLWVGE